MYKRQEGSVAVPDLVKDKASYLGYLTVDNNGKSGKVDLEKYYTVKSNTVNAVSYTHLVFRCCYHRGYLCIILERYLAIS